jgi:6,7-dimethyl-8-ribityllumazine synthase
MTTFTANLDDRSPARIGIAATEFNEFIVEHLLSACVATLKDNGVGAKQLTIVKVPGAFELPLTVQRMAEDDRFDAFIALGCVIRGATPHFDYVSGECARGLSRVALKINKPVIFGVLTVDNLEQAIERSGTKAGNKGADAAIAALRMLSVLRQLES